MRRDSRRGRIGRKLTMAFVACVLIVLGGTGWGLYNLTRRSLELEMSNRLVAVAQLLAGGLEGDAVRRLRPGDESLGLYIRLAGRLRRAREMVGAKRIYVFDREGRSLLDTAPGVTIGREYVRLQFDRTELASVWRGTAAHSVLFQDEDGEYYQSGYAPVKVGEEVVAGVGVDLGAGFLETIREFRRSLLIFGGISAALTVLVGLGLARNITNPVRRLVESARDIGEGRLERAVASTSGDELGLLAETMEVMRKEIVQRDAQLREMLGAVAHEIRNPLGGIELYAGLIADELPDGDPRKAHIRKVIQEVQTLNRVISEFLDFARPSTPAPAAVSVGDLVKETGFLVAPEAEASGVRCIQEVAEGLTVFADPDRIRRALLNLMRNAVQAMSGGGVLTVRARQTGDRVWIEVADTGQGLVGEALGRAFDPFFTTKAEGTGLGLAIVRRIAREYGGDVEVESEAGRGSTFRMTFPRDQGFRVLS